MCFIFWINNNLKDKRILFHFYSLCTCLQCYKIGKLQVLLNQYQSITLKQKECTKKWRMTVLHLFLKCGCLALLKSASTSLFCFSKISLSFFFVLLALCWSFNLCNSLLRRCSFSGSVVLFSSALIVFISCIRNLERKP